MRAFLLKRKTEKFPEPMIGVVEQAIATNQTGRVKVLGTSWPAKFHQVETSIVILPDEEVYIIGRCGLTMLVIPVVAQEYNY
jgi:membrane protein implicated in regulation of membrane protease activity